MFFYFLILTKDWFTVRIQHWAASLPGPASHVERSFGQVSLIPLRCLDNISYDKDCLLDSTDSRISKFIVCMVSRISGAAFKTWDPVFLKLLIVLGFKTSHPDLF